MIVLILEKFLDDCNVFVWLVGWNVINLIQGIGIFGVLYVVLMGGWVVVVIIVVVVVVCCYIGKFLVDCLYEELK